MAVRYRVTRAAGLALDKKKEKRAPVACELGQATNSRKRDPGRGTTCSPEKVGEGPGVGGRIGASIKLSGVPCEVVYEPHAVRCGPSASRKG